MAEIKKKSQRRKFRLLEGKDRFFVYAGFAVVYISLFFFLMLFYNNLVEKNQLEMKFDSEKSFNSVYMAMNESMVKAVSTMNEEKVSGFGLYSTGGHAYRILGDAPEILPWSKLADAKKESVDSTAGIYFFDKAQKQIEYLRLSTFSVMLESGTVRFSPDGKAVPMFTEMPEIVYLKFDGAFYFSAINKARFAVFISLLVITGVMILFLNIYEKNRKYKAELAKSQSLAKLGMAARTLTHEIKNPLSAMTIQCAILKKTLPGEFASDINVLDGEIRRLTNLTDRVSEFLKNPAGNPKRIELADFIAKLVSLYDGKVAFERSSAINPIIEFDPDLARSVFENLIKNALESTSQRDPEVSVEIRLLKRNRVCVSVSDRGDGLPDDAKEKLYDPFFTTKIHGTGTGLAISRQFVQARGGYLKLDSRENGGTVASVILPCAAE